MSRKSWILWRHHMLVVHHNASLIAFVWQIHMTALRSDPALPQTASERNVSLAPQKGMHVLQ